MRAPVCGTPLVAAGMLTCALELRWVGTELERDFNK